MSITFISLIILYGIEYIGAYKYLPIIKSLHISQIISLLLFIYVLYKENLNDILQHKQTKIFIGFLIFTFVSIFYAVVQGHAFNEFKSHFSYFQLFVITYYIVNDKSKFNSFLKMFVAFHVIILALNIGKLGTGTRAGYFQAGYFFGDGNDFAWGINIAMPFCVYLIQNTKTIMAKILFSMALMLMAYGVIGTMSRGGALAMFAALGYFFWNTKNKLVYFSLLILLSIGLAIVLPAEHFEKFYSRIETIEHYEQDNSANVRLSAWKAAIQMAFDFPFGVGAGNFSSAFGRFYRDKYMANIPWGAGRWISPHSIYFSVLGEYGFIGLFLLLFVIYKSFRNNNKILKIFKNHVKINVGLMSLLTSVNMAIIAYSIGGIFLGGVNYPHLYVITSLSIRAERLFTSTLEVTE